MSDIPEVPGPFTPKRNARLDNVIEMLKDHIGFPKKSEKNKKLMKKTEKNLKTSKTEKNIKTSKTEKISAYTNNSSIIPTEDSNLTNSYLMWQNSANVCWLDASMALLVHNRTLIESINESSMAQISKIIYHYYKAVSMLNDCSDSTDICERVMDAKDMLKTVQESTLKYLQPILKYKEGEPDSAFCSLLNLIVEDKSIKAIFCLEYTWVQVCQECKTHRAKTHRKPIITLPRVEGFQPSSPISLYQCLSCKAPDQRMTLNFKTLPQCLLFHFESGAGKGDLQCTSFKVDKRIYQLTGVMTHQKGKESNTNHFVTFIRDSRSDMWMECNDLCDDIMCFSVAPPTISLQDVYILMFEAMDVNGTVPNLSLDRETYRLGEESTNECMDIPLIDLEDEAKEDEAESCRNVASEYEESKNILGNVDLPGKDREGGSNKDVMENSCLNGNDPCGASCENANLQGKDSVNISNDDNSKEVGLFGTAGLFAKFHLAGKDNSSQNFEVYQGGSEDNAVHDITMSACDNTTLSECNEALPGEITSTDAIEIKPTDNAQSQLHINNIENNSLLSESIKVSTANACLDNDILSLKINNVKSLGEVADFPKGMQPETHIIDGCASSSGRSKSSKGAKKKFVKKDKLVSHHHETRLSPEKATNKTSANFLVPEPLQSESIEMSTADVALDKDILSLKINNVKSLGEVTDFPKDMQPEAHIIDGCAASGSGKSKNSKGAKKKFVEKDKLVSHHQKTLLSPEKCANKTSANFIIPESLQSEFKKMSTAYVSLDRDMLSLKINNEKSLDEVTHVPKDIQPDPRAAISSGRSNSSKGAKKKLIEKNTLVSHHQKTLISPEKSTNETANILVPEKSENCTSDVQLDKIDSTSLEAAYRNASYTLTENKTEITVSSQSKTKSLPKNRRHKLGSSIKVKFDDKLQDHNIKTSCIAPETTSESSLHNVQVIKKHKIEKVDQDLKNSNNRSNKQLITKQRKTQTVSKTRKQKSVDGPVLEDNSSRTDHELQQKAIIIANLEKVIDTVSKLGNFDVIEEQLEIHPDSSSNNLNLSNELPNCSSIPKQTKAKSLSKKGKRKFMDSLQSEDSTKMDDVLQKNFLPSTSMDKSSSDVPSKKTKCTRRNIKPAAQQQNETISETAKNKTSDDNDRNDKYPSSDSAKSKVNDLLPSNRDGKMESLHGPGCLCDGMKMAEDLVDIVVGNVLKNMFNFLGIKEKK